MAVDLTGLPAGLFTRLGTVAREFNRVVSSYGASLNSGVSQVASGYSNNEQIVTDSLYATRDAYRGVHGTYLSQLQTVARNTIVEQVNRDVPLPSKTLSNALTTLFRQMESSSDSVPRPTTSVSVTAGGDNLGDGVLNVSLTNEFGDPLDLVQDEDISLTVDSVSTTHQESMSIQGEPVRTATDYLWPGGSGASGSLAFTDAGVDGILTNANFQNWSGSPLVLGSWVIGAGTAGTHIVRSSDTLRIGTSYTLQFVSDGTTLPDLYQTVTLQPNRVYAFNIWGKMSSLDGSGQFRVRLTDGSNTTLTNDAGSNLSQTVNLNGGFGTGYTQAYTFFSTPRQLPSSVRLHLEWTTAPSSSKTLNLSLCGLAAAEAFYPGGPFRAAFSKGATKPMARGDRFLVSVANNAGTATWTKFLDRVCDLQTLRLYPPTSNSPTIANSLLT